MKCNRGVTMTSLVIYVIGLTFIIGLMSVFSGYFYKKSNEALIKNNSHEQYVKFLAYITKDVNDSSIQTINQKSVGDGIEITFSNGKKHEYVYENSSIYYINTDETNSKKITLCRKVEPESNKVFILTNNKIDLDLKINGEIFSNNLTVKIGN